MLIVFDPLVLLMSTLCLFCIRMCTWGLPLENRILLAVLVGFNLTGLVLRIVFLLY